MTLLSTLSGVLAKSVTIDVKNAQNCQTQNIMYSRVDGNEEEGKEVQDGMSSYNSNFTCGRRSGDGIGQEAKDPNDMTN